MHPGDRAVSDGRGARLPAPPGRIGTDIAVARARKMEDGRTRIILVTARNMPFFELYNAGRSTDYPFGWFELYLDESGKGEGRVIVAAKIKFDKQRVLQIESYGLEPFKLSNIRRNK
ncbi:MAG: hypothetical protein V3T83_12325 [Acidobacteriota bacterium]